MVANVMVAEMAVLALNLSVLIILGLIRSCLKFFIETSSTLF